MRRRWRARFDVVARALKDDEENDALELLRASLRRRGGAADVAAVVRWAVDAHAEQIPAGERPLVDDLVAACLLAYPAETTAALFASLRNDGPPWIVALLGSSTHAGTGASLLSAIELRALDEDGLVVFIEALHQRATFDDASAREFLAALDEEPLPRKAKGALRSARFRLGRR